MSKFIFGGLVLCICVILIEGYIVRASANAASQSFASSDNSSCPENSSLQPCGSICEPTCFYPHILEIICSPVSTPDCPMECRCNAGYYRDDITLDNGCVRLENCS